MSLQFLAAMFDPMELAPNAEDLRERRRFVASVRRLETEGEVLVTVTGNVTAQTGIHAAALYDILRAGDPPPRDLVERVEQRRFAAILVGRTDELECGMPTCDRFSATIARNYFVAGRRHEREHTGTTGYDGRARWILRPRKSPLPGGMPRAELSRRLRVEQGLATAEEARTLPDVEPLPVDEIEAAASRLVEGSRGEAWE